MRYQRGIRFSQQETQAIFDELREVVEASKDCGLSMELAASKIKKYSTNPDAIKAIVMLEAATREFDRWRQTFAKANNYIIENLRNW